jgi:hypothetical protein
MKLWPFFKRDGALVYPAGIIGWLLILVTIVYAVFQFIDIDSRQHSVSDTLMNFVFNLFIDLIVLYILALITSKKVEVRS